MTQLSNTLKHFIVFTKSATPQMFRQMMTYHHLLTKVITMLLKHKKLLLKQSVRLVLKNVKANTATLVMKMKRKRKSSVTKRTNS